MVFVYFFAFAGILFMCFDVYYFSISFILYLWWKCFEKRNNNPLEESIYYGICTPTDLDFNMHMNNSRYLRILDKARVKYYICSGIWGVIEKHKAYSVMASLTIRYRRSVTLFHIFRVRTKLIYWDEKAFYLEHRLETWHDNFLRTIVITKLCLINITPNELLQEVVNEEITKPEIPLEIQKWIESNEISSENLKKER